MAPKRSLIAALVFLKMAICLREKTRYNRKTGPGVAWDWLISCAGKQWKQGK
jgi:hypothetical protein